MSKKDKVPVVLRVVRWFFPRLERVAPALANRLFIYIFFTPLRYKADKKEMEALRHATRFSLTVNGKHVQGYRWGNARDYVLMVHGWAGRATQFRRFVNPLMQSSLGVVAFDGPAHGNSGGRQTSLLEFNEAIRQIVEKYGTPRGILSHSFGGVASLYAVANGLPAKRIVMVSSPSIGDEVIRSFLKAVDGSWKTGAYFKEHIKRTQGRSFDEFSGLYLVQHLPPGTELLVVHDENDKEVDFSHALALVNSHSGALLVRTRKLGHVRILRDDEVIRRCVTFLRDTPS